MEYSVKDVNKQKIKHKIQAEIKYMRELHDL